MNIYSHCWKGFQGHGVKGQVHTMMTLEILWTRQILNHWRDM